MPYSLPIAQQLSQSLTASHALLSAGFGVRLDPALNTLPTPGGNRQLAPRYLVHLPEAEQKRLATRAIPALITARYRVNIARELFDEAAYRQAVHHLRTARTRPTAPHSAPAPGSGSRLRLPPRRPAEARDPTGRPRPGPPGPPPLLTSVLEFP